VPQQGIEEDREWRSDLILWKTRAAALNHPPLRRATRLARASKIVTPRSGAQRSAWALIEAARAGVVASASIISVVSTALPPLARGLRLDLEREEIAFCGSMRRVRRRSKAGHAQAFEPTVPLLAPCRDVAPLKRLAISATERVGSLQRTAARGRASLHLVPQRTPTQSRLRRPAPSSGRSTGAPHDAVLRAEHGSGIFGAAISGHV
jgi:hypothetical protein